MIPIYAGWKGIQSIAQEQHCFRGGHNMQIELLTNMVVFARVVEARSFTEAARRLGSTKSAISKQISRLESELGTRLMNRTTRQLSLTDTGLTFYAYCARIVADAEEAQRAVSELRGYPKGRLRVAAPSAFARLHLMPGLAGFMQRYPELEVEFNLTERAVDLAEDGIDLAVSIVEEPGQNMVARSLAPIRWVVCATPAYLAAHGEPGSIAALADHNCLSYATRPLDERWHFTTATGEAALQVHGNFRVNNNEALREVVLGDHGIALLPTYVVWRDLQAGRLRQLLTDCTARGGFGRHIQFVYLPSRFIAPKRRAFIDYFITYCGSPPYWDQPDAAA
jgi:DNA-binding transcriptional LysR family regulator